MVRTSSSSSKRRWALPPQHSKSLNPKFVWDFLYPPLANDQPIGIFDSGVGGLSIWNEIHRLLPNENSIYLADSLNAPYGERDQKEIIRLSVKNTELLLRKGAKIIVVACNTATTNAIDHLRRQYDVPFIGIEPATKPAAINTKTGKIGILATKGTLASELYLNTSSKYRGDVEIIQTVGTGLVQIIESGSPKDAKPLLKKYLAPMVEAGVDNIVLGCSHYPFLVETIRTIIPEGITIIDSGEPVARQTERVLRSEKLLNEDKALGFHHFYTNASIEILQRFIAKLKITGPFETDWKDF
ncbi:MAG: glutamate racemase [Flavobacteriales bacterium]|nr:glutamate racemase [Flavobacteriales bacterium]